MEIAHRQLANGELKLAWASWTHHTGRPGGEKAKILWFWKKIRISAKRSDRSNCFVFGISGKLCKSVREWHLCHADILKPLWVIKVLNRTFINEWAGICGPGILVMWTYVLDYCHRDITVRKYNMLFHQRDGLIECAPDLWPKCTWEHPARCQRRQDVQINMGDNGGIWCFHGKKNPVHDNSISSTRWST